MPVQADSELGYILSAAGRQKYLTAHYYRIDIYAP
jgi:hypothetical protein